MRGKRGTKILSIFLSLTVITAVGLKLWTEQAETQAHYTPDYAKEDLTSLLKKDVLTEEEYSLLFYQTGLSEEGVDLLYASGRQGELLCLQERFFAEVEVDCFRYNGFVRSERLHDAGNITKFRAQNDNTQEAFAVRVSKDRIGPENEGTEETGLQGSFLPTVETGDVLITFSGHVFGWRSGHAAIVVDGEKGLTLEAVTMGCDSRICSIEEWETYPCFALLRLKGASRQLREQIAAYAEENLSGIPYLLTAFTGKADPAGEMQAIEGTQCAHLVWEAYRHFGYDLDSDGGYIVTPEDLYQSSLLTVIQVYGIDPGNIKKV